MKRILKHILLLMSIMSAISVACLAKDTYTQISQEEASKMNDEQITTEAGDIVLYAGDRIVIFYGSNSWAYTKLGHIDQAQEEMKKLLGQEDVEIQLEWKE